MITAEECRYLIRLGAMMAIVIPLLIAIVEAEPFGMWTSVIVPVLLPVAGLVTALHGEWHK